MYAHMYSHSKSVSDNILNMCTEEHQILSNKNTGTLKLNCSSRSNRSSGFVTPTIGPGLNLQEK